jgi:hypothetical protein
MWDVTFEETRRDHQACVAEGDVTHWGDEIPFDGRPTPLGKERQGHLAAFGYHLDRIRESKEAEEPIVERLPRVEGSDVRILKSVQEAINEAQNTYRRRFGAEPTHVALPPDIAPDGLNLGNLDLGRPSAPGVVIVGRPPTGGDLTS